MIETMPRYAAYAGGMAGGIGNPLGARALYLYRGDRDTYFRLHGTNEPDDDGHTVSSGCIRLFNHDIIDIYNRVPVGAPVVVLQGPEEMAEARGRPARRTALRPHTVTAPAPMGVSRRWSLFRQRTANASAGGVGRSPWPDGWRH